MMQPTTPIRPAAISPSAKAPPVPTICSVSDRIIVVVIRGRFQSAYPSSPMMSGTIVRTQVATMTRDDFLSAATSARALLPLAPGSGSAGSA